MASRTHRTKGRSPKADSRYLANPYKEREKTFCPRHPKGGVRCIDCTNAGLTMAFIDRRDRNLARFKAGQHKDYKAEESKVDVDALHVKFDSIDLNGDGKISKNELKVLMRMEGEDNEAKIERYVNDFFRINDADGSGSVEFQEFVDEYVRMQKFKVVKGIQSKFQNCDQDDDGKISKDELLGALISALGRKRALKEIDECFDQMDADNSGTISMEELAMWYMTTAERHHQVCKDRIKHRKAQKKAKNRAAAHRQHYRADEKSKAHTIKILYEGKRYVHDLRRDVVDFRLKQRLGFNMDASLAKDLRGLQEMHFGKASGHYLDFVNGRVESSRLKERGVYRLDFEDRRVELLNEVSAADAAALRVLFMSIDADDSSVITTKELQVFLKARCEEELKRIHHEMDDSFDSDFRSAARLASIQISNQVLMSIFTELDHDSSGTISYPEFILAFGTAMHRLGSLTPEEEQVFRPVSIDPNDSEKQKLDAQSLRDLLFVEKDAIAKEMK